MLWIHDANTDQITPSHSRCSTASDFSAALDIGDSGLGWVAVMPDAIARVDVNVNGERLSFEGYGYHDKVGFPPILYRRGQRRLIIIPGLVIPPIHLVHEVPATRTSPSRTLLGALAVVYQ